VHFEAGTEPAGVSCDAACTSTTQPVARPASLPDTQQRELQVLHAWCVRLQIIPVAASTCAHQYLLQLPVLHGGIRFSLIDQLRRATTLVFMHSPCLPCHTILLPRY
jgi:hypothetical protein